ncbi:zinc metalloprotease [Williamsoniiplasma somnilux]|uniref:Zinc metalloprotease n=1 Tax=Williamsoniiplasma somnilux TaxID=215578 RepID=A0A2K8NX95_9MOLU|nr:SprT family zinc-dependent metalloprotease [Williamsoniiplasma somnilux]ATZ18465.1 zinc metalloprotease [Williamsoniiplasma somnilux]
MSEIKKSIQVSGHKVNYFIRYGQQKNIILRVKEGKIYISAPVRASQWEIDELIYKNYHKINKVQNNYEVQSKYDFFASKPWIKIFDQQIEVILVEENIHTKMANNVIFMKNYYNNDEQIAKLYTFLAKQYKNWFNNRSSQWAQQMGLEYKNLSIKVMNMKWGVCYPTHSKIIFNTKLLHFKPEIIDYVIVHELSHLRFANHSRDFWYLVAQYLSNYKELSNVLDKSGI